MLSESNQETQNEAVDRRKDKYSMRVDMIQSKRRGRVKQDLSKKYGISAAGQTGTNINRIRRRDCPQRVANTRGWTIVSENTAGGATQGIKVVRMSKAGWSWIRT